MTKKRKEQFNNMLKTLRRISKGYMTPAQIKRDTGVGIEYEEYLEYSYENIQSEAKLACKGIKEIDD